MRIRTLNYFAAVYLRDSPLAATAKLLKLYVICSLRVLLTLQKSRDIARVNIKTCTTSSPVLTCYVSLIHSATGVLLKQKLNRYPKWH